MRVDSLTTIRARPCCPGATVAAVVRSPCPRSSANALRSNALTLNHSSWLNSSTARPSVRLQKPQLLAQQLLLARQFLGALLHLLLHLGRGLGYEVGIVQARLM